MPPERSLTWLGKEKEKKALILCEDFMEKVVETVTGVKDIAASFKKGKKQLEKKKDSILKSEERADEIKDEIIDKLSKSSYPSLSCEKIIRLVLTTDHIADNARAAAIKMTFLNPDDVDEELRDYMKKLSELSWESVKLLKKSIKTLLHESIEKSIERTADVEGIEEEADKLRATKLVPKTLKWADESHKPGTANLFINIGENIEEILDQAEGSADVIREIAIGAK